MKDEDKLAMILAQLRWLRLPGMARALEALLTRAKKTRRWRHLSWPGRASSNSK